MQSLLIYHLYRSDMTDIEDHSAEPKDIAFSYFSLIIKHFCVLRPEKKKDIA